MADQCHDGQIQDLENYIDVLEDKVDKLKNKIEDLEHRNIKLENKNELLKQAARNLLNVLDKHATFSFGEEEDELMELIEKP